MKSIRLKRSASKLLDGGKSATVIAGILIAAVLCALFFFVYHNRAQNPDFEGTIVDRWADYAESEQGSKPRFRLLVESPDGKRSTIKVEPSVYASSRVGMRIKSSAGQVVLIDSKRSSNSGK